MKNWIRTSIAAAVIATGAAGASAALAWGGGGCMGDGPHGGRAGWQQMAPEQMKARIAQRADERLARMELALALTPQQKPAWEAFKGAMTARAERMATRMAERRTAEPPKTAIERLQRMEEMGSLRQTELAEVRKAVEAFYVTLSDAQKTVFDAEFRMMGGKGTGGRGRGAHDGMGFGRG